MDARQGLNLIVSMGTDSREISDDVAQSKLNFLVRIHSKEIGFFLNRVYISDGLHPKNYKDIPERNKTTSKSLQETPRSSSSRLEQTTMKPATYPMQEF